MKKIILFFALLFCFSNTKSQIILSNDTTLCGTYTDTLYALSSTASNLTVDDGHGGVIPIGFTFNFYGNAYTQLVISGNGYITFDLTQANQYSPWSINTTIPNPGSVPENAILAPWHDMNPFLGGDIFYGMAGVAPNRVFVVTYCAVPMYGSACAGLTHTSQVVLYEGSDKIEMYIENKPLCVGWNGGQAIQGLVDATSANADIVPDPTTGLDRNFGFPWAATNEGWEFIPNGATAYTINTIPYVPIVAGQNTWTDMAGNILGVGATLAISTTNTTTIIASVTGTCTPISILDSITITIFDCYDLNINSQLATCFGNDGILTVSPDTILPLWDCDLMDINGNILSSTQVSLPDSNYNFTNLVPGTYIVRVTTATGGINQDTVILAQQPNLLSLDNEIKLTNCLGQDGYILVKPIQQTNPWNITLMDSTGSVLQNINSINTDSILFSSLNTGTYILYVDDIAGCTTEDTIIVSQIPNPLEYQANVIDVSCYGGSDGQIGVFVDKGLEPYTFYINGIENLDPPPYDSLFTGLSEDTYIITAIDSDSCSVTDTIAISAPQFPLQVLSQNTVNICDNSTEGTAIAYAAGGSPYQPSNTYLFEWFDDDGSGSPGVSLGSAQATSGGYVINNLGIGNYFLEVTDSNGCDAIMPISVVVTQQQAQSPVSVSPQITPVSCYGQATGAINAVATGGFGPYDYDWSNDQNNIIFTEIDVLSSTVNNLTAGTYNLLITDTLGCQESITVFIPESNSALESHIFYADSINDCYGGSEGNVLVQASGGAGGYTYLWSTGSDSTVVDSLSAGLYTVTITDGENCTHIDTVEIIDNPQIQSNISITNPIRCNGESDGVLFVSTTGGGISPYNYNWSTVGVFDVIDHIDNLSVGTYHVTTRDALGCTVTDTITLPEPDILYVDASEEVMVSCYGLNDGQATVVGVGGTTPYTYSWVDALGVDTISSTSYIDTLYAGLHTVIITDDRDCIATDTVMINQPDLLVLTPTDTVYAYCVGINSASLSVSATGGNGLYSYQWDDNPVLGQVTSTAVNLDAGIYTCVVTDQRGCQDSVTIDIDSVLSNMSLTIDNVSANSNSISCYGANDGAVFVSVNAGGSSGPYTYFWTGPGFVGSNDTILNLSAGTYSVTVTDVNGCIANQSVQISEPSPLQYTVLSTRSASCLGSCDGSVELYFEGGTSPYTAMFDNGSSTVSISANVDSIFSGLCTGSYTVTLEDNNECVATLILGGSNQATLSSNIPTTSAIINPLVGQVLCYGDATGSLEVLNPNSNPGYTYSWESLSNSNITIANTISNLSAGTYVLSALYTDSLPLCTSTDTFSITQLGLINSSYVITDVDCHGDNTGSISTTTSGGAVPYTYSWSPISSNSNSVSNLFAGVYTLTITDVHNCTVTESYTVNEPAALQASISASQTYILNATVSGGTAPYQYSWRESSLPNTHLGGTSSYTVGSNGDYYVIVTDANDCKIESNSISFDEPTTVLNLDEIDINIYPNPFNQQAVIDFGKVVSRLELKLFDVLGKLIEEHIVIDTDQFILNKGDKLNGIYFLEVETDTDKYNNTIFKLIIE